MANPEPEKLWASVVGDPEPWRRGRVLLAGIAVFYATAQAFLFFALLLTGAIEHALGLALTLVLWWVLFSFVWFGTHWVRWLLGAYTLLISFAQMIWALRDGGNARFLGAALNFVVGILLFAPSVHFFAVRQRKQIRWLEKLIVVAGFLLLIASLFFALIGINVYRAGVQREAERYGQTALRRLFVENDTTFVLNESSDAFRTRFGQLGISELIADKFMRVGDVTDVHVTGSTLHSRYTFPVTISYAGEVFGEGDAACGKVRVRLEVLRSADDWRIHGFWWHCPPR